MVKAYGSHGGQRIGEEPATASVPANRGFKNGDPADDQTTRWMSGDDRFHKGFPSAPTGDVHLVRSLDDEGEGATDSAPVTLEDQVIDLKRQLAHVEAELASNRQELDYLRARVYSLETAMSAAAAMIASAIDGSGPGEVLELTSLAAELPADPS